MAGRGFFAEIQHQAKVAARESENRQRAAARQHDAAVRRVEQARKAEERALAQANRAAESERKQFEKEAKAAHVEAMQAEVEERNAGLAETYDEIDGLLAATLEVDDYVDLEQLRRVVDHPPFERSDLEVPIAAPPEIPNPSEPTFTAPEPPKGLIGKKKKHVEAMAAAEAAHASAHAAWRSEMDQLPARRQAEAEEHARFEADRQADLESERARHEAACKERDGEVSEHNEEVDTLIANLGYGAADAVQEYVSIVLANSAYPDQFAVEHEFEFESSTAELRLNVLIPSPELIPSIKAYKYTKAKDEISSTALSLKDQKERYAGGVHQVALRSLHEIFEADRRGLIRAISVEVGTNALDPATGREIHVSFVAVAVDRETFVGFDLSAVLPSATLEHLGAAVSKNPLGLVAIDAGGVRKA